MSGIGAGRLKQGFRQLKLPREICSPVRNRFGTEMKMKKSTKRLIALAGLGFAPVAMAAPGYIGKDATDPLMHHYYAHRGLFEKDQSIPENSLPAFARACDEGYGMELDVQLSKDGEVVVFHDDDLKRMCGVERDVAELTYEELQELSLAGTTERIPLFQEVLSLVGGRTPMIIELKTGARNDELCEKTLALLKAYDGVYCIESFDPEIVFWFRKNAPKIVRGQLAMPAEGYSRGKFGALGPVLLSNTCFNVLARPHFIAYKVGEKAPLTRLADKLGAIKVGWVTHCPEEEKAYDISIFEWYRPDNEKA